MSNTTVRAAAEGMPKIKTDALTIIPLIDEFRAAHTEHMEAREKFRILSERFDVIRWRFPSNFRVASMFSRDVSMMALYGVAHVQEFFDDALAKVEDRVRRTLFSGSFEIMVARESADILALRTAALAALEPKQAEMDAAGYQASEVALDASSLRLEAIFQELLDATCLTFADAQAKASLLLGASSAFGGELEYSESQRLLRSILTVEA